MNKSDMSKTSETDWTRLESMSDADIDYSDIPELPDSFFTRGEKVYPVKWVSLDADILTWFKAQSQDYPAVINTVLRKYMELQQQVEKIAA